ncbi:hypothetical protein WS72_04780 [Burkholderia savannae]|uniref:Uncharacterized protein n=1 Tax=Burkholderia savannae TaxID=1637837 RepID=A0ABR5TB84_9BURK|nr:hypothetical protein WS72_04780 [Burkholderia savannae]
MELAKHGIRITPAVCGAHRVNFAEPRCHRIQWVKIDFIRYPFPVISALDGSESRDAPLPEPALIENLDMTPEADLWIGDRKRVIESGYMMQRHSSFGYEHRSVVDERGDWTTAEGRYHTGSQRVTMHICVKGAADNKHRCCKQRSKLLLANVVEHEARISNVIAALQPLYRKLLQKPRRNIQCPGDLLESLAVRLIDGQR